jgi:transcriptional regulator with XRE-family HTH domain
MARPRSIQRKVSALGANLRRFRERAELAQEALAEKAGVPRGTIAKLETGKQSNAELDTLQALCGVLGCSIEDLIAPEGKWLEIEKAVQAFTTSPEAQRIKVSEDDLKALLRQPWTFWKGVEPNAQVLYHLVLALRSVGAEG